LAARTRAASTTAWCPTKWQRKSGEWSERQTTEAFFKASKHVFGMANLRSRRFLAIAAFLGC
jgi:hypothetical protein